MAIGANKQLQIGLETTWGTKVAGTEKLNWLSESVGSKMERRDEPSLNVGLAAAAYDIVAGSVSGDTVLGLKPENVGLISRLFFGVEPSVPVKESGSAAVYRHTWIPQTTNREAATMIIDRGTAITAYSGMKIASIKLDAKTGDILRATITWQGKVESTGSLAPALSDPVKKSYRFINGTTLIGGSTYGDVEGISLSMDLKLDGGLSTQGSGIAKTESISSLPEYKISLDCQYDSVIEGVRTANYLQDAKIGFVLNFVSENAEIGFPYSIKITIPNVQVDECTANISGPERIKAKLSGKALQVGVTSPITFEHVDMKATKY